MVSFNPFNLFKFSRDTSAPEQNNVNPTFDPNTLTMVQPGSPNAPTMNSERVVSEQPGHQQGTQTQMQLRGGHGDEGCCCGL
ncbi:hypothetical protein BDW74DRAFT_175541 [Aspergillus multicolor]|uniref:uncharacterized protein n=1 Tax=Aspergillus multicolor TaxID=41759 RepID=UPI003CCD99AE